MAHDEPDFDGWLATLRRDAGHLYPANVILAKSEQEMRDNLAQSHVLMVESFPVVKADLEHARNLRIVQKFGTMLRNIDESACQERGIKVLTIRRRANIACAEHAFALMLMLARRLNELDGVASTERLAAITGWTKGSVIRPSGWTTTVRASSGAEGAVMSSVSPGYSR